MASILLIGSGLSAHLGMPGWAEILQKVARTNVRTDQANEIDKLLSVPGHEYQAASLLAKYLGSEPILEDKITRFMGYEQTLIKRLHGERLSQLRPVLLSPQFLGIITTNWDTLLSELGKIEFLAWPAEPSAEGDHLRLVLSCLREKRKFIWHLHGALGASPLVITESQRQVREQAIKRNKSFFIEHLAMHGCSVLGSGFSDPHLVDLMLSCVERSGSRDSIRALLRKNDIGLTNLDTAHLDVDIAQFPEFRVYDEAVRDFVAASDETYDLIDLDTLTSANELLHKLDRVHWHHNRIYSIKDASNNLERLTNLAAKAAIEAFRSGRSDTAGLLSTILSTCASEWYPERHILDELARIAHRKLASGNPEEILPIEPLAWAIGRKGEAAVAEEFQWAMLADENLRGHDYVRVSEYYGNACARYAAYKRHLNERPAYGILSCWDLPRLMVDLKTAPLNFAIATLPIIKRSLVELARVDIKLANDIEENALKIFRSRERVVLTWV